MCIPLTCNNFAIILVSGVMVSSPLLTYLFRQEHVTQYTEVSMTLPDSSLLRAICYPPGLQKRQLNVLRQPKTAGTRPAEIAGVRLISNELICNDLALPTEPCHHVSYPRPTSSVGHLDQFVLPHWYVCSNKTTRYSGFLFAY